MRPADNARSAIGLIVLSALLFSIMDATTKYLSGFLSVVVVLWTRYTIQAGITAAWIWRSRGAQGFRTRHPRFQALRGMLLLCTSAFAFFGLRHMPLAEFTAIIMLAPVLVTAASGRMSRQPIGAMHWALVWGGFVGTLIVIRPGSGLFGAAAVMPLMAMFMGAGYSLATSRLAVLEDTQTTQFYTGMTGSLALLPALFLQRAAIFDAPQGMKWMHLALLIGIGLVSTLGHLCVVLAFKRAGAALLMPFSYAQIAFAAAMSWLLFRHAPDFWAWVGMAMIAACGGATAWLNMRRPRG
jgi:drug/metabolite transporter (DMT)-like permease